MSNDVTPSEDNSPTIESQRPQRLLLGIIMALFSIVAVLPIAYLIGLVSNVRNIVIHHQPSPQALANVISESMALSFVVCLYGLIGLVAIFVALFATQYHSKLLYWFWIFVAIVWILSIPFGSLFGLGLLIVLMIKRHEFSTQPA